MTVLHLKRKLAIRSDAAKYDASCAPSGAPRDDSLQRLLRTPGQGVSRLIATKRLTLEDVRRLCGGVKMARPFIVTDDWSPGALTDRADLRARLAPEPLQPRLF